LKLLLLQPKTKMQEKRKIRLVAIELPFMTLRFRMIILHALCYGRIREHAIRALPLTFGGFMSFPTSKSLFAVLIMSSNLLSSHAQACGAPTKKKVVTESTEYSLKSIAPHHSLATVSQNSNSSDQSSQNRDEMIALRDAVLKKRTIISGQQKK
jgi:hypothetical protein